MGYDIHITRRKHWAEDGDDITAEEWLEYVQSDPDFRLDPRNGPYHAEGTEDSPIADEWLDWHRGAVYSKYPNAAMVDKMVVIANHFGGIVQGDEGEVYTKGEQFDPGTPAAVESPDQTHDPSKEVFIAFFVAMVVFAVLFLTLIANLGWQWRVSVVV